MRFFNKNGFVVLAIISYLSLQLFSLSYQPLPWFDETYFASIAENFIQSGKLKPSVAVFEEVKIYGFLYFLLTGLSMKLLGMGIWSFRLVNACAGLACIGVMLKIFQEIKPLSTQWIYLLVFLLALDPFLTLSLHEGRMDLTALFFVLFSYRILFKQTTILSYTQLFLVGFLWTWACLTTPRVAILAPGLVLAIFLRKQQTFKRALGEIGTIGIVFMLLYSIWIFYAFGGYVAFVNYYLQPTFQVNSGSMAELFLGGNLYIPRQEYALIIITFILLGIRLFQKPGILKEPVLITSVVNILLFYGLVRDYGPYSIFILPFYYIILLKVSDTGQFHWKNPALYLLIWLFIHHGVYFSLKNLQTLASFAQRNPQTLDLFIQEHIPKGSRVVGEPMFFYAVRKTASDFQYMDIFETLEAREQRQREVFSYEYLIVSDHLLWRKPEVVNYYLQKSRLRKIARLEIPINTLSKKINDLGLLSNTERTGYNCTIYQRIP